MSDLSLIKELREKTGAGFLDCKNALSDNDNNIELSIDSLRKKGLAKATKKSSREANEGAVGFFKNKNISVILKINSETDFSAKSDTFLDFLDSLGNIALKTAEGTARLIGHFISDVFGGSTMGKLGYLIGKSAFRALKDKMDPRELNGGVFLGLNGLVVKSHGLSLIHI